MPAPRVTTGELDAILAKKGYGIASEIGRRGEGIKCSVGETSIASSLGGKGEMCDVERGGGYESLRAQAVALNYTGKCKVRIKFYRRRLADYSRANCEKFIIDALVYGGVIRDDSENEIWLIDEGQEKVKSDDEERVEINLEYEEVDLDNLWVSRKRIGNIG